VERGEKEGPAAEASGRKDWAAKRAALGQPGKKRVTLQQRHLVKIMEPNPQKEEKTEVLAQACQKSRHVRSKQTHTQDTKRTGSEGHFILIRGRRGKGGWDLKKKGRGEGRGRRHPGWDSKARA